MFLAALVLVVFALVPRLVGAEPPPGKASPPADCTVHATAPELCTGAITVRRLAG